MEEHRRHPLPPHERHRHHRHEPTHEELMTKIKELERMMRRIEERL